MPVGVKDILQSLGITKLNELASTSPAQLQGQGLGSIQLHQISVVLENFFVSLDRVELLRDYSRSVEAWEPYLSHAEIIREAKVSRWLPNSSIERLYPKDDEPDPPGLNMPVQNLKVSVRASNCLTISGIANVHELALASPRLLLGVRNLGLTTLSELAAVVEMYFSSLEPGVMAPYEESYQLWKPLLIGRAPSPEVVRLWLSKPVLAPVAEISPPNPAIYGDPPRPPGLDVPIADLLLPARALTCLERWGVTNLHELALIEPLRLLKANNFGRKSLDPMVKVLKEYFDALAQLGHWKVYDISYQAWKRYFPNPPGSSDPQTAAAEPPSVTDIISTFLSQQNERDRGIFVKRFALISGSTPQTLGTIGRSTGLSRQSIWQITTRLHKRAAATVRRHRPGLVPGLRAHLDKVAVTTMDELASLLPNSGESTEFHFGSCVRMLLTTFPGVHAVNPEGQLWTSLPSIDRAFYFKVLTAAKGVLRRTPTDLPNLALETARKLGCRDQEIDAVRVIIYHATSIFAAQPFKQTVIPHRVREVALKPGSISGEVPGVRARRRAFAYAYLRKQGVPATVFELFDAMEAMESVILPHHQTRFRAIHTLRSLLEHDDRFAWAGVSSFGLREWGYEPDVTSIGQAIDALLRKKGPLTLPKILKALGKLFQVDPNRVAMTLSSERGKTVTRDSHGRWQPLP